MEYEEVCNIRIIGDSTVGKTSILNRFSKDIFHLNYSATMGFDYYSHDEIINNKKVRIKIWDTAGQERFRSLTASFFRNSQGIIISFDVTNQTTFFNLKFWIDSLRNNLGTNNSIQIIIVGNKIDLKSKREVSFEDADKFCLDNNLPYFECSAKEGNNVKKSILFLVERIFTDFSQEDVINRDSFNIRETKKQSSSLCC